LPEDNEKAGPFQIRLLLPCCQWQQTKMKL